MEMLCDPLPRTLLLTGTLGKALMLFAPLLPPPPTLSLQVSALMSRRRRSMVGTSTGTDSEHGRSVVGTPVASNADAMERSSSFSRKMLRGQQVVVTQEVLLEAVGGVRPSVSGPERSKYSKM